jgi:hypothetical protein
MSRSYRRPFITDGYKGSKCKQFFKRYANKVIRGTVSEIADGKAYRKFFESWSICDYKWKVNLSEEEEPWKVCRK